MNAFEKIFILEKERRIGTPIQQAPGLFWTKKKTVDEVEVYRLYRRIPPG
ncbi:hypothetical protein SAMN04488123_12242 [Natribacillus halophilus]|uniref:Uncharacterized protein n=1 Tax=Natribacillus halophilus TaxID=549003 RepID=A0A1G8S3Q7_9BACI|nr:hypothetical protein SAMN04488123_12242 [Natribacillus halophilus]